MLKTETPPYKEKRSLKNISQLVSSETLGTILACTSMDFERSSETLGRVSYPRPNTTRIVSTFSDVINYLWFYLMPEFLRL